EEGRPRGPAGSRDPGRPRGPRRRRRLRRQSPHPAGEPAPRARLTGRHEFIDLHALRTHGAMEKSPMEIRADEISRIIKQQIQEYGKKVEVAETGTVLSVGDGIARVYG